MPQRHKVVSHEKWLEARRHFLQKEKAFIRLRDRLNRDRRNLPWERVDKAYVFDGPDGKETLAQLFFRHPVGEKGKNDAEQAN